MCPKFVFGQSCCENAISQNVTLMYADKNYSKSHGIFFGWVCDILGQCYSLLQFCPKKNLGDNGHFLGVSNSSHFLETVVPKIHFLGHISSQNPFFGKCVSCTTCIPLGNYVKFWDIPRNKTWAQDFSTRNEQKKISQILLGNRDFVNLKENTSQVDPKNEVGTFWSIKIEKNQLDPKLARDT